MEESSLPATLIVAGFLGGGFTCLFAWAWVRVLERPPWPELLLPFMLSLGATLACYGMKEMGTDHDGWKSWLGVLGPLICFGALVIEQRFLSSKEEPKWRFDDSTLNLVLGLVLLGVAAWATRVFDAF